MELLTGIIICSRLSSSRVPLKPLLKYNGKSHIELLIGQLIVTGLPIYLAVPENEVFQYGFLLNIFPKNLCIYAGNEDDPLARQFECAKKMKLSKVIRVTHDKVFIDTGKIFPMLKEMDLNNNDYIYSSDFIPGTGFEIISFNALERAASKFIRVEHVSYAVKAVALSPLNYRFDQYKTDIRLLIDYAEDVQLMNVIFATLGTDIVLSDVVKFLDSNQTLKSMNKLPLVTIYTCAKNAAKWIGDAMGSVSLQSDFKNYEYILIDDHSDDKTLLLIAKFCQIYKNARFIRNEKNVGLSSSSNVALKNARGNYIVRLDADDFFIGKNVLAGMVEEIEKQNADVIYPNCYAGLSQRTIQKGSENHHVGGSLFRTSAINHIKFTDSLRNHDSLDLFLRAKDQLKIGFYNRVVFCYRQHNESMSKNNLEDRAKTRKIIESKYYNAKKV